MRIEVINEKIHPKDAILVPDSADKVFKGIVFDVYQWEQELYDGSHAKFEMLKRVDTVSAICVVDDRIVVLDEEQPLRGRKLSFPGGRVDPDDKSTQAAIQREVHEETGYSFKNWKLIKVFQPQVKNEYFIHIFIAFDVIGLDAAHVDPGEKIEVKLLDFDSVKELTRRNEGFMGESASIFEPVSNIKDLMQTASFDGVEVDR